MAQRGRARSFFDLAVALLSCILLSSSPQATAQPFPPGASEQERAAEFSRIYGRLQEIENPEETILLAEQALKSEPTLKEWRLATPREAVKGDLWLILGRAYQTSRRGDRLDNLRRAVETYRSALTVFTRDGFPHQHLRASRLLGQSFLEQRDWRAAGEAYSEARMTFQLLFGHGAEDDAQTAVEAAGALFSEAAYAALQRGDQHEAWSWLDKGKAQLMSAALQHHFLDLAPENATRLAALKTKIREWKRVAETAEAALRARAFEQLAALRRELTALTEEGGQGSIGERPLWAAIRRVPQGGAIVAPVITGMGAKILLLTKPLDAASNPRQAVAVLDLPQLDSARIDTLLHGNPHGGATAGWMNAYARNCDLVRMAAEIKKLPEGTDAHRQLVKEHWRVDTEWREAIEKLGPDLWTLFAGELDKALAERGVGPGGRIIWLPSGPLGLFPLGLAQDPVTKRRLGDTYEIAYAPSLSGLKNPRRMLSSPPDTPIRLAGIANPTGDLAYAEIEGALVARHFSHDARALVGRGGATQDGVLAALKGRDYWHFSTHGTFDWSAARKSRLHLKGGEYLSVGELNDAVGLGWPRLVVLSACETGLYDTRVTPDEFIGLPATFLALGATGVISTLWLVDDRATMLLVSKFFDLHLRENLDPPTALKRAQDWIRQATRSDLLIYAEDAARDAGLGTGEVALMKGSLARGAAEVRFGNVLDAARADLERPASQGTASQSASPIDSSSERPFAHPFYWAAFIHTGM